MVIAAAAKSIEKTRSQARVQAAQQGPLRCAVYNRVYARKKERGVMVGKEKNNRKDTTKAKIACLLARFLACACVCARIYTKMKQAKQCCFFSR